MTFLLFARKGGTVFMVPEDVREQLASFAQHEPHDLEAGGVLLGRILRNGGHVVVDTITTPQPADIRSRFSIIRDGDAHQVLIDLAWGGSAGTCGYLGEWHTHPEADPVPSKVDLAQWKHRTIHDVYEGAGLLFVIVGTEHIRVWESHRATNEITPCLLVEPQALAG